MCCWKAGTNFVKEEILRKTLFVEMCLWGRHCFGEHCYMEIQVYNFSVVLLVIVWGTSDKCQ